MNARKIAFDIIFDALEKNVRSDHLISRHTGHRYFRFIGNLTDTTLRNLLLIDHIIDTYTEQDLSTKKFFRYILRCIVSEIYFLKTPHHAIFYEWINVVKRNRNYSSLSGTLNAVLHDLVKRLDSLDKLKIRTGKLTPEKISTLYSIPLWIIDKWSQVYTLDKIETLAKFFQKIPDTTLRFNTRLLPREKILKYLKKDGIELTPSPHFDDVAYVRSFPKPIKNLSTFCDGLFYIQDESSIAFIRALSPIVRKPAKILDATVGPGGKLGALYQYLESNVQFTAWDPGKEKLNLCVENFARLKIEGIHTQCLNITKLPISLKNKYRSYFDYIFLDPPCSGLGTMRRKPQVKFSRTPEKICELTVLQKRIFGSARRLLKPGGLIFWSLCTNNPEETTENVSFILKEYPDITLIPFPRHDPTISRHFVEGDFFSPMLPETKTDYLFGAIFKKN